MRARGGDERQRSAAAWRIRLEVTSSTTAKEEGGVHTRNGGTLHPRDISAQLRSRPTVLLTGMPLI